MKKTYNVDVTFNNMRIDRWIRKNLGNLPQGFIEKNLRNGKIKLNNKKIKSSHNIQTNDQIELFNIVFKKNEIRKKIKFKPSNAIIKENENLIIDNNDNFVVVNKEPGIAVQGGTKSKKNLIDIFAKSSLFKDSKPYSVHRLDKDTSGVFIIAKNRETAQLLTSLFRLRKVHKTYLAICNGEVLKVSGKWDTDLVRYEKNKPITENAKTFFKVLDKNSNCSLIEMKPITGRKHQLRKQLSSIGHPIYGDHKYNFGVKKIGSNKNLMLHAYQIKFMIKDKKYSYTALLPDYFKKLLKVKKLNFSNY
tara:strand:- start:2343 stop:3257 length:915 start_codon:yes stop_codon:yes gene_type:complete